MKWFRALAMAGLTFSLCAGVLVGCVGYGPNRLRVLITDAAIEPSMDGHRASCGVLEPGGVDGVAWGNETLRDGGSVTIPMYHSTGAPWPDCGWEGVSGVTYGIEVWIDMDDDLEGPEAGIDYVTTPVRLDLVLDASSCGTEFVIDGPFVLAGYP